MTKYPLLLWIFLTPLFSKAQNFQPSPPLDIPLVLSGTFGELRANHFHAGIDIKTQGRSGLIVKSVADGYISRISVSPYGYGNALYVRHPEGYTTVYGHLNAFAPEVEAWVESQLRDRSKNDGNLYPEEGQFAVDRGELIAYSGNTGGSMGPHLHFEIRDTRTEEPLNPLEFGLKVADTRAPNIRGLRWTDTRFITSGEIREGDTLLARGRGGLDLFTTDKQNGAENNNGVYTIEAAADGEPYYQVEYRRINFNTSRFINGHFNFEYWFKSGSRFTRLYELDNNELNIMTSINLSNKKVAISKGWIEVKPDSVVRIDLRVTDFEGNADVIYCYIKGGEGASPEAGIEELTWNENHLLEGGAVRVEIPSGAMYHSSAFPFQSSLPGEWTIGGGSIALQKAMTVHWTLDSTQSPGVGWFAWELGRGGKKSALVGEREGEVLTFTTRSTGTYYLDQDLRSPVVSLVQSTPMQRSNSQFREIRVRAEDDKTGVDRYSARIDGEFARIDFDYKRNLLKVIVPKEIGAGNHNLRIVVIDGVGNTTSKDYTLTL